MAHSTFLRSYEENRELFFWRRKVSNSGTLSQFPQKFDLDLNEWVFPELEKKWFELISVTRLTIIVDHTVILRGCNSSEKIYACHSLKETLNIQDRPSLSLVRLVADFYPKNAIEIQKKLHVIDIK